MRSNGNNLLNELNRQGSVNNNDHDYSLEQTAQYRQQQIQALQNKMKYEKLHPSSSWTLQSKIVVAISQAIFFIINIWYFSTVHIVDAMHPILIYLPLLMIVFSLIIEPAIFSSDTGKNLEFDSCGIMIIAIVAMVLNHVIYQY